MINYFDYAWPKPESSEVPFEPTVVVSDSPWGKGRKLVHIGIKGYEVERSAAPDVNLVLLLDVSGSMNSPDKLPLAVQSMELLLGSLKPTRYGRDRRLRRRRRHGARADAGARKREDPRRAACD